LVEVGDDIICHPGFSKCTFGICCYFDDLVHEKADFFPKEKRVEE
jgi:hypothetical protein